MPLTGASHQPTPSAYFKTLAELDSWAATPTRPLSVLKYCPRPSAPDARGKLLVCHDYKGGYTESPFSLGYTFNFWSSADIFIYFSHHRVTVPPPGWITAAHRQGVKMLGTLIFEGGGEEDCLKLLVGRLPKSKTGPAQQSSDFRSLPLSPHYARVLADLAHQRGFDGYLLNFECPLQGGVEQTRALSAWITLLVDELKLKIGTHAEVVWYDSVVVTGQLAWQDRLNSFNLPFFLSSTAFFTNYTWPPSYTARTADYFRSLGPSGAHIGPKSIKEHLPYKALEHIAPAGLSTAFFGQGWTWENTQDNPGFTWESWFSDDRRLWTGPRAGEHVQVPAMPANRPGEPPCSHGPFASVASFFSHRAPPDPRMVPLHTTFSPGVGRGWWVDGIRLLERPAGWTDLDKQTSIGDLVWPVPLLAWHGDSSSDALPVAKSEVTLQDAWNGGSSLRLALSAPGEAGEDAAFRCVWLPVQSVTITPTKSYEATVVYKLDKEDANVDLDIALSVKRLAPSSVDVFDVVSQSVSDDSLPGGWTKLCIRFETSTPIQDPRIKAGLGLIISIISEDVSQPLDLSLLLGQLNIYPAPLSAAPPRAPMLLWANFSRSSEPNATPLDGTLTWEAAATFAPLPGTLSLSGAEDTTSAWAVSSTTERWFPRFLYFNVYASVSAVSQPQDAVWIGTSSGFDGQAFGVREVNLPFDRAGAKEVTFYVQGVTDRGAVLPWHQCVFVTVSL
ncbi:glycoside hydrolase family 85 protein [Roridomyces roridus]|uniref:Glycoside hydrolase family 85 protein n=1 Tax=Roridomyces roridus TaxID=1738132 RepID=A0AAD7BED9_9AGAR|nr:glycoside hydrolase family 85 protein [Roridomyces roridus]